MKILVLLLFVAVGTLLAGCSGTEDNPEYLQVDCVEGQLVVLRDNRGVKQFVSYHTNLPLTVYSQTLVFACRKEGKNIIVLDRTALPFSSLPKEQN